MALTKKQNPLTTLANIRRGTYKNGSKCYGALMHYRKTDPYKLTSHDKIISYNISKDAFTVK